MCYPFHGKLYVQDGKVIDSSQSLEQIISMNWLEENVLDSIHVYDELITVNMVGGASLCFEKTVFESGLYWSR